MTKNKWKNSLDMFKNLIKQGWLKIDISYFTLSIIN